MDVYDIIKKYGPGYNKEHRDEWDMQGPPDYEGFVPFSQKTEKILELMKGFPIETQWNIFAILYDGRINDWQADSKLMNRKGRRFEEDRRFFYSSLAELDPQAFAIICSKNVNLFHGTNSNAISNILKNGMNSAREAISKGYTVSTGEYVFR